VGLPGERASNDSSVIENVDILFFATLGTYSARGVKIGTVENAKVENTGVEMSGVTRYGYERACCTKM